MAISATMTIWGLYQYDPTIFDNLHVPTGITKDEVVAEILLDGASLEILYPQPDFLREAINVWSTHRAPIWAKMLETTEYEYNPIYNYDRTEEITETENGESSRTTEVTNTADTETSGEAETIDARTGYNSGDFANTGKQTRTGSDTSSTTGTTNGSENGTNDVSRERSVHMYGNIGVMSTQEMIAAERSIVDYDVSQIIADEFINKFCIGVY